MLGYQVYRCADPLIALMISAMDPGGEQGWHFDDNEFVVSLLLQKPARGRRVRVRADDPKRRRSRRRPHPAGLRGRRATRCRWRRWRPGTLALFRGTRSLHRVSPVVEGPTRLIALLSYDREPGMVFPAKAQLNNTGRTTHV